MRTSVLALAAALVATAAPASAAVVGFTGVALSTTPTTFSFASGSSFQFTFNAADAARFDSSPYAIRTTGTAQSSLTLGQPSSFFTANPILVGPNTFPGFGSVSTLTDIPFSLSPTDLALRYAVGNDFFYGYARLIGGRIDIGFETQANTAVRAGSAIAAVPEPATWAMMIGGFGLVGAAMRRRSQTVRLAA